MSHSLSGEYLNGPSDLADMVVDRLRAMPEAGPEFWLTETSLPELKRLIEVAFITSLAPEEGRYPVCSLLWSVYPNSHEFFDICKFDPRDFNVEILRRLAPICQTRGSAILVALQETRLQVVGMTATRFEGLDFFPGRPGFYPQGREPSVQVHILGPGRIRVECAFTEIELREGKLRPRQFSDLWGLPCLKALATEFGNSVAKEVINRRKLGGEECKLFGGLLRSFGDEKLIELMLRPILEGGHGGTVLVIPSREAPWLGKEIEQIRGVSGLSLHERAVEHLTACVACHYPAAGESTDPADRIKKCLRSRGRLIIAARTIADLASVDGCVVMDRSHCVLGFGAKIKVPDDTVSNSQIQFKNAITGAPESFDELTRRGGMRWQSALRLCRARPNVIACVISQDRVLTVVWSEQADAFAQQIAISTIPMFG